MSKKILHESNQIEMKASRIETLKERVKKLTDGQDEVKAALIELEANFQDIESENKKMQQCLKSLN